MRWHQTYLALPDAMFRVERWFDDVVAPLFDSDGELAFGTKFKLNEELSELREELTHGPDGDVAEECADVIVCCFLWARAHNVDLGQVLRQKTNVVVDRPQERQGPTWHHGKVEA